MFRLGRDNRVSQNIRFTMHLGDFQNPGNPFHPKDDDIYEPDTDKPTGKPGSTPGKATASRRPSGTLR